jgi:Glycosyl hydrolase family 26
MNRAALAARLFLVVALLPAIGAASFAAYMYRSQPPIPPGTFRQGKDAPQIVATPTRKGLLVGTYAPSVVPKVKPGHKIPPGIDTKGLAAFDKEIGSPATLTVQYTLWGKYYPANYVIDAAKLGAETIVELEPRGAGAPTLAQIASGRGDAWLKQFAHEIVGPRDHFILSFAPEMNGAWYQYGSGHAPAGDYVRAFRRVHDVLIRDLKKDKAANLISFMWQPSAIHISTPTPAPYWPGAKYVDDIGVDGYYFFPTDTFRIIFGQTLKIFRSLAPMTPVLIGETAVGPRTGHQAADIRDLFAGIHRNHLLGLIWFDKKQDRRPFIYHQDWNLHDHPAALAGFNAELASAGAVASFARRIKSS